MTEFHLGEDKALLKGENAFCCGGFQNLVDISSARCLVPTCVLCPKYLTYISFFNNHTTQCGEY